MGMKDAIKVAVVNAETEIAKDVFSSISVCAACYGIDIGSIRNRMKRGKEFLTKDGYYFRTAKEFEEITVSKVRNDYAKDYKPNVVDVNISNATTRIARHKKIVSMHEDIMLVFRDQNDKVIKTRIVKVLEVHKHGYLVKIGNSREFFPWSQEVHRVKQG